MVSESDSSSGSESEEAESLSTRVQTPGYDDPECDPYRSDIFIET